MWCANLLNPRGVDMCKNSDTSSDIVSETGTGTSDFNWDSRDELKDFLAKLGLNDVTDLYQERFRVDRRKLEQMLTGDNDALIPADVFFAKLMEDTDTYITWPNKLKIGAKSKKDPHVRIAGRPKDVQTAKERVITILNTRCNRITMKMDVSYTDHSHIIGKGGLSIKRVMEETHCHVHFPDSNRSNPLEKSNQVSISGDLEGVECARSRVRELMPLIFGFELPIMSQNVDSGSPYLLKIQEQYKVQVIFKTRPKLHATLVLVKGVEWEVKQVKRATLLLMEHMCDKLASQIPVQMSIEISPHHHQVVMGKNHSNLKTIMQYTNCQIMFPDALDPNIPSLKKSNINITGNINNVYRARQLLMGSLPLIIIFDLPEDVRNLRIKPDQITEIQFACDLTINIRQKAKQNGKSCIIKGVERYAAAIYRARNMILGIDEPPICPDIPPSYHMPTSTSSSENLPATSTAPVSPLMSPLMSPTWQYPVPAPVQHTPTFLGMVQQKQGQQLANQQQFGQAEGVQSMASSSGYHSMGPFPNSLSLEQSRDSPNSVASSRSNKAAFPSYYRHYHDSPADKIDMSFHSGLMDKKPDRYSLTPSDFDSKRLAGYRAMQARPSGGSWRLPNDSWSGYGLSHTSPGDIAKPTCTDNEDIWKPSTSKSPTNPGAASLNNSNILDHTPLHILNCVTSSQWHDIPAMLTSLGLERYIKVFNSHEIDLTTFATFTDQDFLQIGINAFGARRKLLLAVSEINQRSRPFLMAPGAERKQSDSWSSPRNHGSPKENW